MILGVELQYRLLPDDLPVSSEQLITKLGSEVAVEHNTNIGTSANQSLEFSLIQGSGFGLIKCGCGSVVRKVFEE